MCSCSGVSCTFALARTRIGVAARALACAKERRELLTSNKDEITSLIQQRQTKELQNRKAREDKIELEQNNLDQIHEGYAESYNILKMKLQKEIQVCAAASQTAWLRLVYATWCTFVWPHSTTKLQQSPSSFRKSFGTVSQPLAGLEHDKQRPKSHRLIH